jgi:ubiquinone/menaquinone biosynthesis C-methylase UbiE
MAAPLISDTWERGDPYEQYVGRWSRRVAPQFLSWLNIPAGRRWLDVGCGTGALSAAILDHSAPISVIGVEPSEGFLEQAKEQGIGCCFGQAVQRRFRWMTGPLMSQFRDWS